MWLNCLTGLSRGIVGIVVILPITCIVHMSRPLSLVFPHSYSLALGQRLSLMCYSSCPYLVGLCAALDGLGHCAYYYAYCLLTDSLTGCLLIDILLPPLVTDLTRITHIFYWP